MTCGSASAQLNSGGDRASRRRTCHRHSSACARPPRQPPQRTDHRASAAGESGPFGDKRGQRAERLERIQVQILGSHVHAVAALDLAKQHRARQQSEKRAPNTAVSRLGPVAVRRHGDAGEFVARPRQPHGTATPSSLLGSGAWISPGQSAKPIDCLSQPGVASADGGVRLAGTLERFVPLRPVRSTVRQASSHLLEEGNLGSGPGHLLVVAQCIAGRGCLT